jgi:hypothetical protein
MLEKLSDSFIKTRRKKCGEVTAEEVLKELTGQYSGDANYRSYTKSFHVMQLKLHSGQKNGGCKDKKRKKVRPNKQ